MRPTLTARQEAFAAAYVRTMNATRAAIEAGYSVNTAGQSGYENLNKPEVRARIEEIQADIAARNDVETDRLIRRLYLIATTDATELVQIHADPCKDCWADLDARDPARRHADPTCPSCRGRGELNVTFTPADQMSPGARALFKAIKVNRKTGAVELQIHDRLRAMDMLARHLGLYRDGDDSRRQDPLGDLIAEICARGSSAPLATD